jgi:hypothetical protein
MPVEEGPGRNSEDEDCGGANEADVNGEFDVLQEISHKERDRLEANS